jgi:hypothetical protein
MNGASVKRMSTDFEGCLECFFFGEGYTGIMFNRGFRSFMWSVYFCSDRTWNVTCGVSATTNSAVGLPLDDTCVALAVVHLYPVTR